MGELIFVGLGLAGTDDLTIQALEAIKKSDIVFAEFYTSRLIDFEIEDLEMKIGKKIMILTREEVESGQEIIDAARKHRVSFLTAGDPMTATTHLDLRLRASESGINTRLIHGVSIYTACASAFGLQHYKFGRTVTLPFQERNYHPSSPYEHLLENKKNGLHSLILLDIRAAEGKYMTAQDGIKWLLDLEKKIGKGLIDEKTLLCAAARVGSRTEKIVAGYPQDILNENMGPPLHTLIMPGKLHFMEARALVEFANAPKQILENI
ncbi:MAG: diphthine synthase [Methanomassiliicoccales archaeon]|jgi:diphthine synthase|nr:diphthine synthase [Methanomassiliicoccales archaeon]